jgi:hypothetical protein
MKKMTMLSACIDFFGLKEGQSKMDFGKEYKQLTDTDRQEIKAGLEKNGYEIMSTTPAVAVPA